MGGKNSTKRRSSNDTGRQAYDQAGWERDFREIFSANLIDARPPPVASNPVRPPRTVRPVEQPSVQASVIHRPAATAPALTVRLPAVESYSGPERFRFLELTYPQVSLSDGGKAAERISTYQDNYVYTTRFMKRGDVIGFSIDKAENGSFEHSFRFGLTNCSSFKLRINQTVHLNNNCWVKTCGGQSFSLRIFKSNSVGDKVTFERALDGSVKFRVNGGRIVDFTPPARRAFDFKTCDDLTPFIQLNGFVSKIRFIDEPIRMSDSSGPSYGGPRSNLPSVSRTAVAPQVFTNSQRQSSAVQNTDRVPPVKWKVSANIIQTGSVIGTSMRALGVVHDRIANMNPMMPGHRLTFTVAETRTSDRTLSFALLDPALCSLKERTILDLLPQNAYVAFSANILEPNVPISNGLKFVLVRQFNGRVQLQVESGPMRTLFTVDAKKRYLALITFDGSVKSLQLMPNEQIPKQTRSRQNQNGASGQSAVAAPVVAPVAEARNECKVCFEREVDCVLISCGHQMICQKCAQYIVDNGDRQCPICRSRIERVQRVFT